MAQMTDPQAYLMDFITIETKFDGKKNDSGFETSFYTGVQDFFETHLSNTKTNEEGLGDIDVYKIKVGDIVKLEESKWSVAFSEQENLPNNDHLYDCEYEVTNVEIEMYSRNPIAEGNIPKLRIKINVKKV